MQQPPAGPDNLSEEELRQKLAEAEAQLAKQVQRARKQFAYNVKLARERLAYAEAELKQAEADWAKAKGKPEAAAAELLRHAYASLRRMMQHQLAANEHNLAIAESEPLPTQPAYRDPQVELDYLEARAYMDVNLGMYYWIQMAEGVDLLLRASGQAPTIVCQSPEEEAARQAKADELKARQASDRQLAILVGQLGGELAEAYKLIEWGKSTLARLREAPSEEKKPGLELPEWNKLNAKVLLLGELPQKASAIPLLAAYLPAEPVELPFEPVDWSEEPQATGTDRLSISTGRLGRPGSNQLSR